MDLEQLAAEVAALRARVDVLERAARVVPFGTLASRLLAEGYARGAPPARPETLFDGRAIDRQAAADSPCELCEHRGLGFRPFFREHDRSYVAVAVCPACGHAQEF